MKRNILKYSLIVGLLTLSLGATSCKDFLTVRPKTSFPDYQMFGESKGFQDAVVGLYIETRNGPYRPGGYMYNVNDMKGGTGGLQEQLSLVFTTSVAANYDSEAYYTANYTNRNLINSSLYGYLLGSYKIITNINLILQWIDDDSQDFLDVQTYNMVKGESLGLKAFIMFDLIRTFGPPPTDNASHLHGNNYIPYVKTLQLEPYQGDTYTQFMQYLLEDLNEAERMLKESDTIMTEGPDRSYSNVSSRGEWYNYRRERMNYYAVCALKARVLLWMGGDENKTLALTYAQRVINAVSANGTSCFSLYNLNSDSATLYTDLIGYNEMIFAVYPKEMTLFDYKNSTMGWTPWTYQTETVQERLMITVDLNHQYRHLKTIFPDLGFESNVSYPYLWTEETASDDPAWFKMSSKDARFNKIFYQEQPMTYYNQDLGVNRFKAGFLHNAKWGPFSRVGNQNVTVDQLNTAIVMIKLAEMYYIVAECTPSLAEAANAINAVRKTRWLDDSYEVSFSSEQERMDMIIAEYTREFMLEGQTFFAYKRLCLDKIPYPGMKFSNTIYSGDVTRTPEQYILPRPLEEDRM